MRRALLGSLLFLVLAGFGGVGMSCSLNPQPLPPAPEQPMLDASIAADSGGGVTGLGGGMADTATAADTSGGQSPPPNDGAHGDAGSEPRDGGVDGDASDGEDGSVALDGSSEASESDAAEGGD